jgi:hypothetical protein
MTVSAPAAARRSVGWVGGPGRKEFRAAAELPLKVILADEAELPHYQELAERATRLREPGMSCRVIGKARRAEYQGGAKGGAVGSRDPR